MIVELLERDVVERAVQQLRLQIADEQEKLRASNKEASDRADQRT
jgi:hypothetical protein